MLRFKSLTVTNFGPYYGTHTINFPEEDGVTFIWAYNGTGKTSLLNAIRFVLYGSLKDSKYAKRPLSDFVNDDAVLEGKGMSVRMDCSLDGERGYIIRRLERNGLGDGEKLEDYNFSTSINWQNKVLSQEQVKLKLEAILPSNIARFYLFDAELLEQYSKLVEEDVNNENAQLKQSIESILGLPVLERAHSNISDFSKSLDELWETESKKDSRHQKKGEALKQHMVKRDQLEEEIASLKARRLDLNEDKDDCQLKLDENSNFRKVLETESACLERIKIFSSNVEEKKSSLTTALDSLWGILFNAAIDRVIQSKQSNIDSLESKNSEEANHRIVNAVLRIIKSEHLTACPACNSSLTDHQIEDIERRLSLASEMEPAYQKEINSLRGEISAFNSAKHKQNLGDILHAISEYEQAFNSLQGAKVELGEIQLKKSSFHSELSAGDLKEIAQRLATILKDIDIVNAGIAEQETALEETKQQIDKIKASLANSGDYNLDAISAKQDFVERLSFIFELAIDRFRDNLKLKVEQSASNFFTSISHDSDYASLRINDNYGLEILTDTGRIVPNRSDGFEQVVAVSLLAALHNNTPIFGPIIMDSTFQRIDPIHKDNTLKALPRFGKQIIVLCYPQEVDANEAKRLVGAHYIKDFFIEKISTFRSRIKDENE